MRERKVSRRVFRKGELHAYVQNMFRASGGVIKPYTSVGGMRRAQDMFVRGAESLEQVVAQAMEDAGVEAIDQVGEEIEWLGEELYDRNPWDESGPNDPPLHSAEAWSVRLSEGKKGQLVISVSNPKDYMQFLEEGWSPQAPAGWIAATFREFWARVGRRLGGLK